jgi:4-hydroxy-tetrahydrodipicolinate reductase
MIREESYLGRMGLRAASGYNPRMPSIRVVHFGLGPIGAAVAQEIAERPGLKIVGGIDIDPAKVGRDVGDVVGLKGRIGVKVEADAARALKKLKPHVVVLCTSSTIKSVMPQIETILKAKVPIVSTTEELAYPGYTHVRQARQIDGWAKKAKVAVLSTGVNPGFIMDTLPIALTASCRRVDRVTVSRIQDARNRRLPFQQKIGAGLTTEQFQKRVEDGSIKHVGFTESIAMIADALGWTLDRITDKVQAKIAQVTISSEYLAVDPGYVCGIVQEGIGFRKQEPVIRLYMEAYLGAPETYDAIEIEGSPRLSVKIAGGIHGDAATSALVVNSLPKVLAATPGLHTMRDMALPSYFGGK